MNTSKWMLTMVMAAGLSVGGAEATWAAGSGAGATVAERCAEAPVAKARIDELQARLEDRLTELADRRAAAESAGRDRLVGHIDRATDRLTARIDRLAERATRLDAWIVSSCPPA